jgi:hypothetical protein
MPDRPDYPHAAALISYASSMGLLLASQPMAAQWAGEAADSASAEWERRSGYVPFLGATQDRFFDPPQDCRLVPLGAGLLSLTSLNAGVGPDGTGGTALALGLNFRLSPSNAPASGQPYEMIEFLSAGYGGTAMWPYGGAWGGFGPAAGFGLGANGRAGSLRVSGTWGRQSSLSDDVYRAVLALGLLTALPELATLRRKGLVSWTEGGVTENYGPKPLLDLEDRLTGIVERVLPLYTRKPLYL